MVLSYDWSILTCIGTDLHQTRGNLFEWFRDHLQSSSGGLGSVLFTQVAETNTQGQELGETILQISLRLLHQSLEDGAGHVTIAASHSNQTTGQSCHTNNLT